MSLCWMSLGVSGVALKSWSGAFKMGNASITVCCLVCSYAAGTISGLSFLNIKCVIQIAFKHLFEIQVAFAVLG